MSPLCLSRRKLWRVLDRRTNALAWKRHTAGVLTAHWPEVVTHSHPITKGVGSWMLPLSAEGRDLEMFTDGTNDHHRPLVGYTFFGQWLHFSGRMFSKNVSSLFTAYPVICICILFNNYLLMAGPVLRPWVYNSKQKHKIPALMYLTDLWGRPKLI